jgi:hypothetical protein
VPLPPLPGIGGGGSSAPSSDRSSDQQTLLDYLLKP